MLKLNENDTKELMAMACTVGLYQQLKEAVENPKGRVVDYETEMEKVCGLIEFWKKSICEDEES